MKQIIFFDGNMKQGGAERVISLLANKMAGEEKNICILLYQDEDIFYDLDSKIKVISVMRETQTNNIARNIKWIRNYVKTNGEIVLSFLAYFNMIMIVACIGLKCPVVVADRNDPRHVPSNPFFRICRDFLYVFSDKIIFQNTRNREYFCKYIKRKSVIIPNPIELNGMQGMALKTAKKKEIVAVGRLMPQKNHELLLRAFRTISDRYPDYKLIIYGEGPERFFLENLTNDLGLSGKVFLPGSVKNIIEKIASSQIFVLSSLYEGMPNALIEAMCIGLPCISTNVSGVEDLIRDGQNGLIIRDYEEKNLSEKISYLLDNPEIRDEIAQKACLIYDYLSINRIIGLWENVIGERFKGND